MKDSPYYSWDPMSPGSLLRKEAEGEPISRADVARVLKANPDIEPDPVLFRLMHDTITGKLKGKRGAKPKFGVAFREYAASELFAYYLPRIKSLKMRLKEAGRKRARSDMSATDIAHALVARNLGYKDEAVVRNLLSEVKNRKIKVREFLS